MQKTMKLPESIVTAVNALLNPYGVDINAQINCSNTHKESPLQCLTPKDAARQSGCSKWTILRAIHAGELPASKMSQAKNGKVLIKTSDLEKWINVHRIQIEVGA